MNKCVFLDRDGVINKDNPDYIYRPCDFEILPGVIEGFRKLKENGFLLVVITNQSGITKGVYTTEDMVSCHEHFQQASGNMIDKFYYSPYHPTFTESLTRKPGSLMFEKAIAKFNIDPLRSFMLGDKPRDLVPAKKLGIRSYLINADKTYEGWQEVRDMDEAVNTILAQSPF